MSYMLYSGGKPDITDVNNFGKAIETNITKPMEYVSENYNIIYYSMLSLSLSHDDYIEGLNFV